MGDYSASCMLTVSLRSITRCHSCALGRYSVSLLLEGKMMEIDSTRKSRLLMLDKYQCIDPPSVTVFIVAMWSLKFSIFLRQFNLFYSFQTISRKRKNFSLKSRNTKRVSNEYFILFHWFYFYVYKVLCACCNFALSRTTNLHIRRQFTEIWWLVSNLLIIEYREMPLLHPFNALITTTTSLWHSSMVAQSQEGFHRKFLSNSSSD